MQEFMLLIRNQIDHQKDWSPEKHEQFLRDCQVYIMKLKQQGKLIAAQPLVMDGMIISRSDNEWNVRPMRPKGEVQVGYYHILAESIEEAIELAKGNPEFDYGAHARIEVRPVQTAEADTGFVYPE
ncbi:MAG TPA: YciI family protein [Methanomassiliicoccales archaeon]|jgi:hypothetical protein